MSVRRRSYPNESRFLSLTATAYFVITWAWAVCWSFVGESVSRKLREKTVERVLGMEMSFFDLQHVDVSHSKLLWFISYTTQVTALLTTDTQAVQIGTSEKVGLFIQSASYFVAAFVVGFMLNARLTAILFAVVIPIMTVVICWGTKMVSHYSRKASQLTEKASLTAEEAIYAVIDVQAFGAAARISEQHRLWLRRSMYLGIRKSVWGAVMLGCVFCIAYAPFRATDDEFFTLTSIRYSANALAFWYGSTMAVSASSDYTAGTIYAVVFLILGSHVNPALFTEFANKYNLQMLPL